MRLAWSLLVFALAAPALAAPAAEEPPRGDVAKGKVLYETVGCGYCHNLQGQGSRDGSRVNPPWPFPAFVRQIRQPRDVMPPYSEAVLSDQALADIHAYMRTFPKPPDAKSLRLLREN